MTGFVSFVSSGPGDPELLTLKALDRLKTAEVILYDDLSAGEILKLANPEADLIGVGKRAGRASPHQNHVSQLLVDYAESGKKTIRLKSGDSGIFGRLEEEITSLNEANIAFEIIPGVTSASAAAAAAEIPLTRRILSRRLQFITGHDIAGKLPNDIHIDAITDPNVTTAIFMGKRTYKELATQLMENGMAKDTPVLLTENVSLPNQSLHQSTLERLIDEIIGITGDGPVLILIGQLMDTKKNE